MENEKEIRYFSMFTGVGGFELGIGDRAKCIGVSEIDKYASELLAQKYPDTKNFGDCTKIRPEDLPDFDFLCGGFPCQSFSIAGKRRGFEDTRGTMFFEIARILEAKRPKTLLLENVKGLLNHNKGETFRVILQTLDELGYEVQWMVLNSKFFGVPQNRERVFIIGSLRGERRPEILPFGSGSGNIDQTQQMETSRTLISGYHKRPFDGTYIKRLDDQSEFDRDKESRRIYSEEGISPTLTSRGIKDQNYATRWPLRFKTRNQKNIEGDYSYTVDSTNTGGIMEDTKIRRLTPTECERLQGFPDGWTEGVSDTQRYKMMGNAVTVNVIKAIAKKIK